MADKTNLPTIMVGGGIQAMGMQSSTAAGLTDDSINNILPHRE
jgi:hypothetical protein